MGGNISGRTAPDGAGTRMNTRRYARADVGSNVIDVIAGAGDTRRGGFKGPLSNRAGESGSGGRTNKDGKSKELFHFATGLASGFLPTRSIQDSNVNERKREPRKVIHNFLKRFIEIVQPRSTAGN